MSAWGWLVGRLGRLQWFRPVLAALSPPVDRLVYRLSGGRRLAVPDEFTALLLHTVGRVSGERRSVSLFYVAPDGTPVVVGTDFGRTRTPNWALNLLASPRAEVEIKGERWPVVARPLTSDEQTRMWPHFDALWPPFLQYRTRIEGLRRPHMFVLEPV